MPAARADYVFGGRKFGGNAQAITSRRWLHHTSFLWDYRPANMALLTNPAKQPQYREVGRRSCGGGGGHGSGIGCIATAVPAVGERWAGQGWVGRMAAAVVVVLWAGDARGGRSEVPGSQYKMGASESA